MSYYNDFSLSVLVFQSPERIETLLSQLGNGELFCDPDFPSDNHALYISEEKLHGDKTITWKRPQVQN